MENTLSFARFKDSEDSLKHFRERFLFPQSRFIGRKNVLYFCGNSLGLQPNTTRAAIEQELDDWAKYGVEGHFKASHPWFPYHEFLCAPMAKVVGAKPEEVIVMNSLTVNLHLLMVSFYRPTKQRYKIICEQSPFPSDQYALASQVAFHGFDPKDAIIELTPMPGSNYISTEHIVQTIQQNKNELAMVMIGGVNYYSGQLFDMKTITTAAHLCGAIAGFDLAHAVGNVNLQLHDWIVDFAVWCSYKYLNSGPGSVGGAYIHEKHTQDVSIPRFAGWWGNDPKTRFTMPREFVPVKTADAWQVSNAPVFSMAALKSSLDIFSEAEMEKLVQKSKELTGYLEFLIHEMNKKMEDGRSKIEIITPYNSLERGCQLSLVIKEKGEKVYDYLVKNGAIADWREPDVIRVAPVPLYNSFEDVFLLGEMLEKGMMEN
ncbi:MAG: kynureninase [Bacteroidia bacterium]